MKIYALAAGYATRLHPLTRDRPKPLLEIGGRPMLSRILDRLVPLFPTGAHGDAALSEIVVVTNARFAGAFRDWADAYETLAPIRVLDDGTHRDDDRLGAIGDLAFALDRVPCGEEPFVVVAGDNVLELELGPVVEAFLASGTPRILVRRVEDEAGPSRYNEVLLAPDGHVLEFREKPAERHHPLAAIALYLFPSHIARRIDEYLAEGGNPDAPGHFLAWLVGRERVEASPLVGEWHDVGSPETLAAARARFGDTDGEAP